MNQIEELFTPLIEAYDTFLRIDDKELGCLNEIEYKRVLADRNYYAQLLVEKMNEMWESIIAKDEDESF